MAKTFREIIREMVKNGIIAVKYKNGIGEKQKPFFILFAKIKLEEFEYEIKRVEKDIENCRKELNKEKNK